MLGSAKISPWYIVRAQHRTYVDTRTGKAHRPDLALFYGLPLLTFAICLWQDVQLSLAASAALLTASGLLGALLFGVMLQVSDRAMSWADQRPQQSKQTSEHATFLSELAANAGYASLLCIASAIAYIVAATSSTDETSRAAAEGGWVLEIASAVGLAMGVHLVLVLLMVIKRVFALTEQRLTQARTGADENVLPHRRKKVGSSSSR